MKSIKIDLLREGGAAGILDKGQRYHLAIDSMEHRQKEMIMNHDGFLERLVYLRYTEGISSETREKSIRELSDFVNYFFDLKEMIKGDDTIQIDLVTNAQELMAIPFEIALNKDGNPWFTMKDQPVVLTRRLPVGFIDQNIHWPAQPRILFAYANPEWLDLNPVPSSAHKKILLGVLRSWMLPHSDYDNFILDEKSVLTTLSNASLMDIEKACNNAEMENKPYTYIHILAHGIRIEDKLFAHRNQYGVLLSSAEKKPTNAKQLSDAIKSRNPKILSPLVVTLCICDAANSTNTIIESRNIAQELHADGVPIVIGSQLPLTYKGSEILTKEFYGSLLQGDDARLALYKARVSIKAVEDTGQDWIGLVGYLRLPEGYSEYLLRARLEGQLAALEAISKSTNKIISDNDIKGWQFDQLEQAFSGRIERLEALIQECVKEDEQNIQDVLSENSGLLGSAYKRLAELQWIRSKANNEFAIKSKDNLSKSRNAYKKGFINNISSHWNGVQYLSLDFVTSGKISDVANWYACYVAAKNEFENLGKDVEDRIWALGSLIELNLLASIEPVIRHNSEEDAKKAINDFCKMVKENEKKFDVLSPIESVQRQLNKYIHWWIKDNGYFEGAINDLKKSAMNYLDEMNKAF